MTNHRDTYARYEMDHPTDDDLEARADDTAAERLEAALDRADRETVNYPLGYLAGGGL
jgi:DNA-directed RNA polymerase subunit L